MRLKAKLIFKELIGIFIGWAIVIGALLLFVVLEFTSSFANTIMKASLTLMAVYSILGLIKAIKLLFLSEKKLHKKFIRLKEQKIIEEKAKLYDEKYGNKVQRH